MFSRRAIKFCRMAYPALDDLYEISITVPSMSPQGSSNPFSPPASRLSISSLLTLPSSGIVGCSTVSVARRVAMSPRDEKHLTTSGVFSIAPSTGSQRVTRVASPNILLAGYTVHRLLFHNCGYFDGKVPLDRRYSIPRWLSYLHPSLFPPRPFRFRPPLFRRPKPWCSP